MIPKFRGQNKICDASIHLLRNKSSNKQNAGKWCHKGKIRYKKER